MAVLRSPMLPGSVPGSELNPTAAAVCPGSQWMVSPLAQTERKVISASDASARDPLSIPSEVKASIRVLVIDDERTLRESCASVLQMDGYNVTLIGRGEEALETVRRRKFDIVLVDLYMSQVSGLEILQAALAAYKDTILVVMTGNPSVTSSIEALRAGAWDYLPKPFSATHLQVLIGRASHAVMMSREAQELRVQLLKQHGHSEKIALIGISPLFRRAVELARKVAPTDASVFISGESGTGKEVIAQFIHQHSRRAGRALVPINCAALPEPLLESEMFGHRKGAFTGADRDKPGLLETANGGTLFLDELTEMSHPIQAKLLRVVPIRLPALRERVEDIPILAKHFLGHYWSRHRRRNEAIPTLKPETM